MLSRHILYRVDSESMPDEHIILANKMVLQHWLPALRCCVGYILCSKNCKSYKYSYRLVCTIQQISKNLHAQKCTKERPPRGEATGKRGLAKTVKLHGSMLRIFNSLDYSPIRRMNLGGGLRFGPTTIEQRGSQKWKQIYERCEENMTIAVKPNWRYVQCLQTAGLLIHKLNKPWGG